MPLESLDFSHRADLSERMDEPCSYAEFRSCLISLRMSNRLTWNYRPTLQWLGQFRGRTQSLHIVDVGSGGGDMLRRIERWAAREGMAVELTGIDLNPYADRAAREFSVQTSRIQWLTGNAFTVQLHRPPDLILSSLFTHHLADAEVVRFLSWMERSARLGWFINDLHRSRMPYHAFRLGSKLLAAHPFVQHDGPISIRRAFQAEEWSRYVEAAGIPADETRVYPLHPSRLCVSRVKPDA